MGKARNMTWAGGDSPARGHDCTITTVEQRDIVMVLKPCVRFDTAHDKYHDCL